MENASQPRQMIECTCTINSQKNQYVALSIYLHADKQLQNVNFNVFQGVFHSDASQTVKYYM